MSLGRGTTDTIRCEVSGCGQKFIAGSASWALSAPAAREAAARSGWLRDDRGRDLCPTHAFLASRLSHGSVLGGDA